MAQRVVNLRPGHKGNRKGLGSWNLVFLYFVLSALYFVLFGIRLKNPMTLKPQSTKHKVQLSSWDQQQFSRRLSSFKILVGLRGFRKWVDVVYAEFQITRDDHLHHIA